MDGFKRDQEKVVFNEGQYTLGLQNDQPYLIANGKKYILTCHPYEPCLYITDESGFMTVVHNAFEPLYVLECFADNRHVTSITGFKYDAADFCRMVEYAAGLGNINIDDAEKVFGNRAKEKKTVYAGQYGKGKTACADKEVKNYSGIVCSDDPFYDLIEEYPDRVVDYCIVKEVNAKKTDHAEETDRADKAGYNFHKLALGRACEELFIDEEDLIWDYDADMAAGKEIDNESLFAEPVDKRGANYKGAFLYPPHGGWYKNKDFDRVNESLFPNGTAGLEIYEWTTDWSEYFDDGHEWWGALCYTIYDKSLDRFVVIMASASD